MNADETLSTDRVSEPQLDALVLVLHEELALLGRLHYRLTALRLLLLDGNPHFIQAAAEDVETETKPLLEHEARTVGAIADARRALGSSSVRLVDLAVEAPESHRKVLLRISREMETASRSISVLRDAVRRQSDGARRALDDVLDLRSGAIDNGIAAPAPGHVFRGEL